MLCGIGEQEELTASGRHADAAQNASRVLLEGGSRVPNGLQQPAVAIHQPAHIVVDEALEGVIQQAVHGEIPT